jgi:hypothetical protein
MNKLLCWLGFHKWTAWESGINAKWGVRLCTHCHRSEKRREV